RALDAPLPAVVVRHVQREERGVPAGLLDRVDGGLAELLADVADDDGGAGPGQCLGHPGAEAAGPAGDQGLASGQVIRAHVASPPRDGLIRLPAWMWPRHCGGCRTAALRGGAT